MWILFSFLCMVLLTAADIVGKKSVDSGRLASIKLRISTLIVFMTIGFSMYAFGLGESGMAPWAIAAKHPLMIIGVCCLAFSDFLYLFCLRYVGMSVMEAISGLEGVIIFVGLFLFNLVTGKLDAVRDMYHPARLILIGVIIVSIYLLPNIETITSRKSNIKTKRAKEKRLSIIGILIALSAAVITVGDSLVSDVILGTGDVGTVDYMMTVYATSVVPLIIFCIMLFKKSKHTKSSCKILNRNSVLYIVFYTAQLFFGLLAISVDAVRSEVMYLTYPVISILGAKIVLKEKYTWKQNLCIWIITMSAIAFCAIDYLV